MAGGPVSTQYTDDTGKNYYYPLHAYLATAQTGTSAPAAADGKWPFKRTWMRHIDVLFKDGTRDSIPIMKIGNTKYTTGGAITVVFPSGSKTGVITGRRGEKVHIAHGAP